MIGDVASNVFMLSYNASEYDQIWKGSMFLTNNNLSPFKEILDIERSVKVKCKQYN